MGWIITVWEEIRQQFISFLNKKRLDYRPVRYQNILLENPAFHMFSIKLLPDRKQSVLSTR